MGFADAAGEITGQLVAAGIADATVVCALGSGGSCAGLLVGRADVMASCRLIAVSVSRPVAALTYHLAELTEGWEPPPPSPYDPTGKKAMCCFPPVVRYQGELIQATFDAEPLGQDEIPDLLYLNFKAPDYAGHVYNMDDERQAEVLGAVDAEIGRLADLLTERFGDGRSVLIVTADHGQCPEIDASGGVRIDPIQLEEDINAEFGTSVFGLVQMVAPSEVYLDPKALFDAGLTDRDVAAFLADYRYGDNIGPYIRPAAIRRDRLHDRSFAAVLPASYIGELAGEDLSRFGDTAYPDADPDGLPTVTW